MKKIISLFALLGSLVLIQAQEDMVLTSLAANTSSNVLAFAAIIDNIYVSNASTNIATLKFFDSNTTSTNVARAAYTSYASYATNFNVLFTNQMGIIVTNTFAGTFTGPTSVSAVTNSRTVLRTIIVPPSAILNKDVKIQTLLGLTVVPTADVTLITTYRKPN